MSNYQIIFCIKDNGRNPVQEYIEKQNKKTQSKIMAYLDNLAHYE